MTYTKDTLKEAIIQKLRLNYGCTEKQATDGAVSYTHLTLPTTSRV